MSNFIADLEGTIGSSLSDADKKTAIQTWSRTAWGVATAYVRTNHSSGVNRALIAANGTISNYDTSPDALADAYFGFDHLKTELKNKVKTNTSLFVYFGEIPKDQTKNRMLVVNNGYVFKFLTVGQNKETHYFNMAKAGIPQHSAAAYYTAKGETTNATNATNAGNTAMANYHTTNDAN